MHRSIELIIQNEPIELIDLTRYCKWQRLKIDYNNSKKNRYFRIAFRQCCCLRWVCYFDIFLFFLRGVFDQLAAVIRFVKGRSMVVITQSVTITERLIYTRIGNISTSSAVRHYVSPDPLPPSTSSYSGGGGGGRGVVDLINFPADVYRSGRDSMIEIEWIGWRINVFR